MISKTSLHKQVLRIMQIITNISWWNKNIPEKIIFTVHFIFQLCLLSVYNHE